LEHRSRLAAAALACVLASACGPREKVVKIAVATPLTGDTGAEGQGVKRAVIMAVEEANASHRFPYKLAAAPFDDRADPKEAVNVANLIISDPRIVAVVGHYTSGCSRRTGSDRGSSFATFPRTTSRAPTPPNTPTSAWASGAWP
jgi:ABC-type branched-subunit amino acid transport system substrate-binding protein